MNTHTETATPAAGQTTEQTAAYRQIIDAIAQMHLDQGDQPMSGDDALLMGMVKGWTITQALQTRAMAVDVEHAMKRLKPIIPHVWHHLNDLNFELDATGHLEITTCGPTASGSLRLSPRGAVALMMFFQFPNVAPLLAAAEQQYQAEQEAALQAQ